MSDPLLRWISDLEAAPKIRSTIDWTMNTSADPRLLAVYGALNAWRPCRSMIET